MRVQPAFLIRCSFSSRPSGGVSDDRRDGPRVRYINRKTASDFNDLRTGTLRHKTLSARWNHFVVGAYQIRAWLSLPSGFADRAVQRVETPREPVNRP
jgi:hypothetical protein